jgi:hypothetical protein
VKIIFYIALNMSVYGYGTMYGEGYRYPRRARKAYIGADNAEKWTKAAVFNTAVARANPWVKFLRENGYYKQISNILQDARLEYYKKPENLGTVNDINRKLTLLERQLESLGEEQDVIQKNYKGLASAYQTTKAATKVSYDEAVNETINKLKRQMANINNRIATLKQIKEQLALAKK